MDKTTFLINETELKKLVLTTTQKLLSEINTQNANDTVFHFTTMDSAYSMIKDNRAILSHATENSADFKVSNNHFFYMSFTRDGKITTSQYPLQMNAQNSAKINVRFSFSLSKLRADGFNAEPVNYMLQRVDSVFTAKNQERQLNFFKNLGFKKGNLEGEELRKALINFAKSKDTQETRLLTNKHILENLHKYVTFVDILLDANYIKKTKYQDIISTFSRFTEWSDKIRFFNNVQDFDNGTNYQTINDVSFYVDQKLSKLEIDFLKKTEKPTFNEKSFNTAANAIYVMAYTNRGIDKIKLQAKKLIKYASLDNYIVYFKNTEDKPPIEVNFMDQILSMFDDIHKGLKNMNAKDKLNIANSAFFNLDTSFSNSRLVFIGISSMYAKWLTAYKVSVVNKFYKIYNELKTVKTPNDVLMFAKRNTLVFMNVFSNLLDTENHKIKFKKFVSNNIKTVNEGRKSNSKIQTNSLLDFVNSICKLVFDENKMTELLKGFKKEYSEFYQLSELKYFKRSVMELKNKTISNVKSDFRKYGHLATLYNNADKANDENGL